MARLTSGQVIISNSTFGALLARAGAADVVGAVERAQPNVGSTAIETAANKQSCMSLSLIGEMPATEPVTSKKTNRDRSANIPPIIAERKGRGTSDALHSLGGTSTFPNDDGRR